MAPRVAYPQARRSTSERAGDHGAGGGLHPADFNIAMADLLSLVAAQSQAWHAKH